jgi:hypothetical protein
MDQEPNLTQEQMLREIYENTKKAKTYMKWQLIITVALIVVPLLALVVIIPIVFSSLSSIYGTAGVLQ